jgi:hypothetical protein
MTNFVTGDRVRFTGAFLRSTGQYTTGAGEAVGVVQHTAPLPGGKVQYLRVWWLQWPTVGGHLSGVLSSNVEPCNRREG